MRIYVNNRGIWLGRFVLYLNGFKCEEMEARERDCVCFDVACSKGDTISLECEKMEMDDAEFDKEWDERWLIKESGKEDAMYSLGESGILYSPYPYITEFEVIDPIHECEIMFKELAPNKDLYYMTTAESSAVKAKNLILRDECEGKMLRKQFIRSIGAGLLMFPIFVGIPVGLSVLIAILTNGITDYSIQKLIAIPVVLLFMLGIFMAYGGIRQIGINISEYQFLQNNPVIRLDDESKGSATL